MKKLLVLLMVLGLASSAQATLSLTMDGSTAPTSTTINVDDTITIGISSDDQSFYTAYIELSTTNWPDVTDKAELLFGTGVASGIGNIGVVTTDYYGDGSAVRIDVGSNAVPNDVVPGIQYSLDLHCLGLSDFAGDVIIGLYDSGETPIQTMAITQVPEPMTLALLGLGGLFLRRRK